MDHRTLPSIVSTSEIALPADLVEAARDFARASHAKRTQETYARWWGDFISWCTSRGLSFLPAAPETVAVWMAGLAIGDDSRKPLARASINQALSAVIFYHRDAGFPFDRNHRVIARTWAGISRTKAKTDTVRKAKPLLATDLRDIVEKLRPDIPIEARDAALLSLGWAAALRRSELVGLDWQQRGAGTGFVVLDERGIMITLMISKASQDAAEQIVIPKADMPAAYRALEIWANVAALEPGQPVFRPIDQHGHISVVRLTGRSVARIVKVRMRRLEHRRGKTRKDAKVAVALFSGHSMRAGYATSAAAKDIPGYRIQAHTRHKSADMVNGYIRDADRWGKSGLKGVGF